MFVFVNCDHNKALSADSLEPLLIQRCFVSRVSFLIHCQERSRRIRDIKWHDIYCFLFQMINEFFDPKSNFCNIYCFFVNSAFIFWSPWAHPVMNVRFWCVAFIRIYRNVRVLGVNIKNKLIHYEIDLSIRQVFGFFLKYVILSCQRQKQGDHTKHVELFVSKIPPACFPLFYPLSQFILCI